MENLMIQSQFQPGRKQSERLATNIDKQIVEKTKNQNLKQLQRSRKPPKTIRKPPKRLHSERDQNSNDGTIRCTRSVYEDNTSNIKFKLFDILLVGICFTVHPIAKKKVK